MNRAGRRVAGGDATPPQLSPYASMILLTASLLGPHGSSGVRRGELKHKLVDLCLGVAKSNPAVLAEFGQADRKQVETGWQVAFTRPNGTLMQDLSVTQLELALGVTSALARPVQWAEPPAARQGVGGQRRRRFGEALRAAGNAASIAVFEMTSRSAVIRNSLAAELVVKLSAEPDNSPTRVQAEHAPLLVDAILRETRRDSREGTRPRRYPLHFLNDVVRQLPADAIPLEGRWDTTRNHRLFDVVVGSVPRTAPSRAHPLVRFPDLEDVMHRLAQNIIDETLRSNTRDQFSSSVPATDERFLIALAVVPASFIRGKEIRIAEELAQMVRPRVPEQDQRITRIDHSFLTGLDPLHRVKLGNRLDDISAHVVDTRGMNDDALMRTSPDQFGTKLQNIFEPIDSPTSRKTRLERLIEPLGVVQEAISSTEPVDRSTQFL